MFAFPQLFSLPPLGVGTEAIEWRWLGALFGWFVVAALVGASLGFLREHGRRVAATNWPPRDLSPKTTGRAVTHTHREAA